MKEFLLAKRWLKYHLLMLSMVLAGQAFAQQKTVTGTVKDGPQGEPLPGVSVLIQGTSNGTITDMNGAYTIVVPSEDAVLVFSFVGYAKSEVAVAGKTVIDVGMMADIASLQEVVVVGYGEQKKSVVTGSISSVKGTQLETMPITRVEQALQGRVSGVTIVSSSGQPGSSATIRVRGLTSINANDPLWVVDGVVVDAGGIGYINQSDIESIEVLKDAASAAIYGTRAAAGVILVTTKKGASGKLQVNYNGFLGTSAPARKLDLLNATQYATLMNEANANDGKPLTFANPSAYGKGTDWQSQIFNSHAHRQNHELSLSGGTDKSTFYTSVGYLDQQGIVSTSISEYQRINLRFNSTHKIAPWLSFGENIGYAHSKSKGIGNTNSEFGGPLSSAINLDPITVAVETDPTKASLAPYNQNNLMRDANGNPYGLSTIVGQELTNPLAYAKTRLGNYSWDDNIVGNMYLQAEPIKGLKIRSSVGVKMAFWGSESFTPVSYLNSSTIVATNNFNRGINQTVNWNLENTISYNKVINNHNVTVLVGQGAYVDDHTRGTSVTYFDIPAKTFSEASMNFNVPQANRTSSGYENQDHTVSSYFGRLNYTYSEKYLLTAIVRRDGSSRFGSNYHFGYFPSFSAGWVASQENFWPANTVVNFLKVRGGYGVVGSDNIPNNAFLSTIGSGRNYTIGDTPAYANGFSPNAPSNPDLRWEQTAQTNVGFETTVLSNINVTFDWFKKKTTGMLRNTRIPAYVGAIGNPYQNIADMENTGFEIELGYKKRIGDLVLSFNGNFSHVQNKVTFLEKGIDHLDGGQTVQNTSSAITRTQVGHPYDAFYGYQRMGIFQNQQQIDNYRANDGSLIQPNAKPGDIIWADLDHNGVIDVNDRKFLGNPLPTATFGMTFTAAYKGVDLLIFGQGAAGNKIYQGLRRLDVAKANWQTKTLGRWVGEGTSNDYPRMTLDDPNGNYNKPSSLYLEKGDYFRIKTLQIGYTLPKSISMKAGMQKARVYLMAENLITFTKYTGYDPEIGGGSLSIDRGIYPQARSFFLGVNVGF